MRENIVQFGNEYLSINKVFEFMRCGLLTGFYFFQARGETLKKPLYHWQILPLYDNQCPRMARNGVSVLFSQVPKVVCCSLLF